MYLIGRKSSIFVTPYYNLSLILINSDQNKTRSSTISYILPMGTNQSVLSLINLLTLAFILFACGKEVDYEIASAIEPDPVMGKKIYAYLALGDSYTVGESVSSNKSFPAQITKQLKKDLKANIELEIIAKTGWRTDNLLDALKVKSPQPEYDFVTLLIGVNNQYHGRPFLEYEKDFQKLLALALAFVDDDPSRVAVISIPNYAFTPFAKGRDLEKISSDIDSYNVFAKSTAEKKGVHFINITDITRRGLDEPNLIANDGLHPSGEAYALFTSRIAPFISARLKD